MFSNRERESELFLTGKEKMFESRKGFGDKGRIGWSHVLRLGLEGIVG